MSRFKSVLFLTLFWASQASAMPPELQATVNRVAFLASLGHTLPVVVTDLDETTIDSTQRRYEAFRKTIGDLCGKDRTGDCGKAAGINVYEFLALPNRYDLAPLLKTVGIADSPFSAQLLKQTVDVYLSGQFLEKDEAVPGATEFLQALRTAGARIFYVTSRYEDTQTTGTLDSIRFLGFEAELADGQVILRPRGMSSIDFKRMAYERIRSWVAGRDAHVELVMENEPENLNALGDAFPNAQAVFIDGAWLKSEPLRYPALRLKNFR